MTAKSFLDSGGLIYLLSKLNDYPTNEILGTVINAIDAVKADKSDVPKVIFNTTANFNADITTVGQLNTIYIYTDYKQDAQGNNIAGIKIGDGNAYLIDAPFLDEIIYNHIEDNTIHITAEERAKWNNKIRAYYSLQDEDTLILTTN